MADYFKKTFIMSLFKYLQLFFFLILAQCYPTPKVAGQFTEQEFDRMADQMAKGTVKDISVEKLYQQKEQFVLLDTRERKEYEISHIPGAIWVGYDDFTIERVKDLPKNRAIITYCSVGYRSERIGEKLQKAGFQNIHNLKGSIFKWVNQGYPIVNNKDQPTLQVHGFSEKWSKWLKKGEIVY